MISIIVPIYNSESFLDACIESILNQSYTDFELLLIDDGSSDGSLSVCQKWAQVDNRIRLFCKENSGASSARNLGILNARGDWLLFVDSDDHVLPHYVSDLYQAVKPDNRIVLVIGGLVVYRNSLPAERRVFTEQICSVEDYKSLFGNIRIHKYGFSASKLYNRPIIIEADLKFDEKVCIAEDNLFMMRYLMHCYKKRDSFVAFNDSANYIYAIRNDSLSTGIGSVEKELYSYNEYKRTISELRDVYCMDDLIYSYLNSPVVYFADRVINSIYINIPSFRRRIEMLGAIDKDEYIKYKTTSSMYEKVLSLSFSRGLFYIYDLMRRFVK